MNDKFSPQLMRGSLDLMVLSILADGPTYGYLIQQRLRQASGERVKVDAGTLYPLLHRLQAGKLVRSKWDDSTGRKRKWYELTKAGRARLNHEARQWHAYAACIRDLLDPVFDPKIKPETA